MKQMLFCLLIPSAAFCASVRLVNDSPYPLRAVIQGADGTKLGEELISPNEQVTWTDNSMQMGYQEPSRSETPYTILWYCLEGTPYSICARMPNAGMITAQTCDGPRQCKRSPPKAPAPGEPTPPPTPWQFAPVPAIPGSQPEPPPPLEEFSTQP